MKSINNEVMLGGFILVAGGLLAYMAIAVGGFNFTPGVHVKAEFTNASGLVKDAAIAIAGVQVGHIEGLGVDHDKAVVDLFIQKDADVREDVIAKIAAKSLLGEKYIELAPQSTTAPLLHDGDTIKETVADVSVDDLMAAMAPMLKQIDPKDVATIVHGVARTMGSQGDNLAAIVTNAAQISDQVNTLLARNSQNVSTIATNMASLSSDGAAMLKAKRPEIEATVTHLGHLSGVLDRQAPGIMRKVAAITTTLNDHAPRLASEMDHTLSRLPGTLEDLSALRRDVDTTMGKVNPLLDKADAFDEQQMHKLAQDILIKNGVRIYMYPFGPPNGDVWKKVPEKGAKQP